MLLSLGNHWLPNRCSSLGDDFALHQLNIGLTIIFGVALAITPDTYLSQRQSTPLRNLALSKFEVAIINWLNTPEIV